MLAFLTAITVGWLVKRYRASKRGLPADVQSDPSADGVMRYSWIGRLSKWIGRDRGWKFFG